MREGGTVRQGERGRDSGVVFLLHQTDRKWISRREETPFWVTGGSAQGLAGGRGEGQEPWLSKLAVLAFHCRTHRHKEVIHNTHCHSQVTLSAG